MHPEAKGIGKARPTLIAPINEAVVAGSSKHFICTSTEGKVSWYFMEIDSSVFHTIVLSCSLNPAFSDRYALELYMGTEPDRCDLIVINATRAQAGTYECRAGFDAPVKSQLVVIDTLPVCTQEPAFPISEEFVTMTCEVTYTSNLSPLMVSWTDPDGNPLESDDFQDVGRTMSSIVVTALEPKLLVHKLKAWFNEPTDLPPQHATNTPDYMHIWNSTEVDLNPAAVAPENVAAVAGNSLTLSCRRRTQNVAWMFSAAGTGAAVLIAYNCQILGTFSDLYRIDDTNHACHLVIERLSLDLAGTYSCQDVSIGEISVAAQLIVLDTSPVCTTNATSAYINPGPPVYIYCKITYSGNISPKYQWKTEFDLEHESSLKANGGNLESGIVVLSRMPAVRPYSARVYFDDILRDLSNLTNAAVNIPSYIFTWTNDVIAVLGRDCAEMRANLPTYPSGVYYILFGSLKDPIQVYCDFHSENNFGWTVFQRRRNGQENFYRGWDDYVNGFGDPAEEFWLGLKYISEMSALKSSRLRIDLADWTINNYVFLYTIFVVGNNNTNYRLTSLGTYSGVINRDSLTAHHLSYMWTTFDRDNDNNAGNCAVTCNGAWWYNSCQTSNLNGQYNNTVANKGINWASYGGTTYSYRFSEMKMRPN